MSNVVPIQGDDGGMDLAMIISLVATDDEQVRRAIRGLALEALNQAHEVLQYGSPQLRTTIIRALIPSLAKTLDRKEVSDELSQLKQAMNEMMQEIQSGARTIIHMDELPPIDTDSPPSSSTTAPSST